MLRKLRPRSVYDVMAAIACFGVLAGGTAYAANTITSADVVNESLLSQDIKNQEVQTGDLALDSVWGTRIKDNGVQPSKLAPFLSPVGEGAPYVARVKVANSGGPCPCAADAVIYNANAPRGFEIADAWIIKEGPSSASATWQLRNATGGGGSEITPARPLAVGPAGTIDRVSAFSGPRAIAANGTLVVRVDDPSDFLDFSDEFDAYVLMVPTS